MPTSQQTYKTKKSVLHDKDMHRQIIIVLSRLDLQKTMKMGIF